MATNVYPDQSLREYYPNLILICGSGRDTGKTFLACNIISEWKGRFIINAIKISIHRHEHNPGMELLSEKEGYSIWKEHSISHKDSGRFLKAGAKSVFYIETNDVHLLDAFVSAIQFCDHGSMIICESGGLAKFIRPAVLLFVQHPQDEIDDKQVFRLMADRVIYSGSDEILHPERYIAVENGSWTMNFIRDDIS